MTVSCLAELPVLVTNRRIRLRQTLRRKRGLTHASNHLGPRICTPVPVPGKVFFVSMCPLAIVSLKLPCLPQTSLLKGTLDGFCRKMVHLGLNSTPPPHVLDLAAWSNCLRIAKRLFVIEPHDWAALNCC